MQAQITQAIVLSRINYGEADRILRVLTRDHGKVSVMAKGVRRAKSKLAGSIELFGVTEIGFIAGRSDIGTLTTAKLSHHYTDLLQHLDKTMLGYELLQHYDKITETACDHTYFASLSRSLEALERADAQHELPLFRVWHSLQLLELMGHAPNLYTSQDGVSLEAGALYQFQYDDMAFYATPHGVYGESHIKFLRIAARSEWQMVTRIQQAAELAGQLEPLARTILAKYIAK